MNTTESTVKCAAGVRYSDQSDETRMAVNSLVEDLGAMVEGYPDGYLTLAMPVDPAKRRAIREVLWNAGMTITNIWYFPLGSDKPDDSMRHDGSYPGSKGFWRFANFGVMA